MKKQTLSDFSPIYLIKLPEKKYSRRKVFIIKIPMQKKDQKPLMSVGKKNFKIL